MVNHNQCAENCSGIEDRYYMKRLNSGSKNVFKHIFASANPNLNLNPKAQKRFWENKMTSFFEHVSRHSKYP